MRLSYLNLLKTSDLTVDSENANYPISNIYHSWKKKVFRSENTSCSITSILDELSDITSVCLAYHNLSSCLVKFYDSLDTLLDTWTLDCTKETEAQYGSVSGVYKIVFECSSSSEVEIGVLFAGDSIYSGIESNQGIPLSSTDNPIASSDRQVSGRKGSVTRSASVTIPLLTGEERKEIEASFYECGLITPFFLDLWDSSHEYFEPIYCVYTGFSSTHGTYDEVTIDIQEVN